MYDSAFKSLGTPSQEAYEQGLFGWTVTRRHMVGLRVLAAGSLILFEIGLFQVQQRADKVTKTLEEKLLTK